MKCAGFIWLAVILVGNLAVADINSLFEKSYSDLYQEGRCGENILNFFKRVLREGEDLSALQMVIVENKGLTVFGMVNAEMARSYSSGRNHVNEKNWYHHVFAINRSGVVYDFDYQIKPTPEKFRSYVENMFLIETECKNPSSGEFCAGRNNKLKDYEISVYAARDVLAGVETVVWRGSLEKALKKLQP